MNRIYIGDINTSVTRDDLISFLKQNEVNYSGDIVLYTPKKKDKQFCILEVKDDITKLIERIGNEKLKGSEIRISLFNPNISQTQNQKNNLFVKNIKNLDVKELRDIFSEFGSIISIKVPQDADGKSKGYGYVQYSNNESIKFAKEKLNNKTVGDDPNSKLYDVQDYVIKEKRPTYKRVFFKNLYNENALAFREAVALHAKHNDINITEVYINDGGKGTSWGYIYFTESGTGEKTASKISFLVFNQENKGDGRNKLKFVVKKREAGVAELKITSKVAYKTKHDITHGLSRTYIKDIPIGCREEFIQSTITLMAGVDEKEYQVILYIPEASSTYWALIKNVNNVNYCEPAKAEFPKYFVKDCATYEKPTSTPVPTKKYREVIKNCFDFNGNKNYCSHYVYNLTKEDIIFLNNFLQEIGESNSIFFLPQKKDIYWGQIVLPEEQNTRFLNLIKATKIKFTDITFGKIKVTGTTCNLFFRNINDGIDEEKFKSILSQFGVVLSVKIDKYENGVNYGFALFSLKEDSENCKRELNNPLNNLSQELGTKLFVNIAGAISKTRSANDKYATYNRSVQMSQQNYHPYMQPQPYPYPYPQYPPQFPPQYSPQFPPQYPHFPPYQPQPQTPYQAPYPSKYNNPKKKPTSKPRNFKNNSYNQNYNQSNNQSNYNSNNNYNNQQNYNPTPPDNFNESVQVTNSETEFPVDTHTEEENKAILGELIYNKLISMGIQNSEKVTGMMLDAYSVSDLTLLSNDDAILKEKAEEALNIINLDQ